MSIFLHIPNTPPMIEFVSALDSVSRTHWGWRSWVRLCWQATTQSSKALSHTNLFFLPYTVCPPRSAGAVHWAVIILIRGRGLIELLLTKPHPSSGWRRTKQTSSGLSEPPPVSDTHPFCPHFISQMSHTNKPHFKGPWVLDKNNTASLACLTHSIIHLTLCAGSSATYGRFNFVSIGFYYSLDLECSLWKHPYPEGASPAWGVIEWQRGGRGFRVWCRKFNSGPCIC